MTEIGFRSDAAAVITGAGGGIGGAVALQLAGAGMSLVLADRDRTGLERLLGELPAGTAVELLVGDVGDRSHHEDLVTAAADLGGLAVSVLNAGVSLTGLSWEVPLEEWELQVRVNYWGVVHGIRAAVPAMIDRGGGHVVALASGAGLVATPGLAPYVSTKHAVVGAMESLHHELALVAPTVHASVVCPGNVATSIASNSMSAAGSDDRELVGEADVLDRVVQAGVSSGAPPESIAEAIAGALADRRFWVLPQPEIAWAATDRVRRMAAGEAPIDLLSPPR
ncbi:MAG: SDR family NAD(P)-dependent oxidoreductase [Microthrixaceae bacterium]